MSMPTLPGNTPMREATMRSVNLDQAFVASQLDLYPGTEGSGRPVMVFVFHGHGADGRPVTVNPIVLTKIDGLAELVSGAVELARKHDGAVPAEDAEPDIATCRHCDRRIFGEVAKAGVCKACEGPDLEENP